MLYASGPRASCALMIMSEPEARGPEEHERAWSPAVRQDRQRPNLFQVPLLPRISTNSLPFLPLPSRGTQVTEIHDW